MRIVMATPECEPFVRGTGLADMVYHLSRALHLRGHEVHVVNTYYQGVEHDVIQVVDSGMRLEVPVGEKFLPCTVGSLKRGGGLKAIFMANADLFNRPGIYGDEYGHYIDNAERFVFFSRGVLEYCQSSGLSPDVIHCFDWPTGLIPHYIKRKYSKSSFGKAIGIFTIFDIRRQGIFERHQMHLTGFGGECFQPEMLEYFGKINFLQAGITGADLLTTTSRRFAEEISSDMFGYGLDAALQARKPELFGILNGVDYDRWNPSRDRFLKANYNFDELVGKRSCKVDLQTEFELPRDVEVPVLALTAPLDEMRGVDLAGTILQKLLRSKVQFVVLGQGQTRFEEFFRSVAAEHPHLVGYRSDDSALLRHKVLGGADMLLMPFRFAPSADEHLKAMRYGTIPIVTSTGALDDPIERFDAATAEGTGFKIPEPDSEALFGELRGAIEMYRKQRPRWRQLVSKAMHADFSWDKTASMYEKLYDGAAQLKGGRKKKSRGNRGSARTEAGHHAHSPG